MSQYYATNQVESFFFNRLAGEAEVVSLQITVFWS
jgi:hypothetical protein